MQNEGMPNESYARLKNFSGIPSGIDTMDIIFINGLKIATIVGIYTWERQVKQDIIIDLEMAADIATAAKSDSIDATLNYKAVGKRLIQFVGDSQYQLVESLAEEVARIVLTEFKVPWLRLKINKKGALRGSAGVGVVIERGVRP